MTTTTSTGHIRKRQYQPSITSYLHRDANLHPSSQPERVTSPLSPPLPPETQASLLSVGMRVRKSVPEGYKTHKTLGTQGFPFPSTAPPTSTAPARTNYNGGSTRELTPFCGLHKTGGWAAQDVPPSSAPAAMQTDREEEVVLPSLTMSQDTVLSTQGSFMSTRSAASGFSRKRTYEEEIEEDLDAYFDDEWDGAGGVATNDARAVRPMARMKQSLQKAATDGMASVSVVRGDDFDEAAFLVPPEGMDMDGS